MKQIICPVDFSSSAKNATDYAANLCRLTGASLHLVYVQPVWTHLLLVTFGSKLQEPGTDTDVISQRLTRWCAELTADFGIACTHDIVNSTLAVEDGLDREYEKGTMIVAGTNGADTLVQRIFGSTAFHIAQHVRVPLLVIPEGVSYTPTSALVFAWDYDLEKIFVDEIRGYAKALLCKTIFLHISRHATPISEDVFRAVSDSVGECLPENCELEFKRFYARSTVEGLNNYMKEKNAGLLAISFRRGKLLRKLIGSGKDQEHLPAYPLLIFHY